MGRHVDAVNLPERPGETHLLDNGLLVVVSMWSDSGGDPYYTFSHTVPTSWVEFGKPTSATPAAGTSIEIKVVSSTGDTIADETISVYGRVDRASCPYTEYGFDTDTILSFWRFQTPVGGVAGVLVGLTPETDHFTLPEGASTEMVLKWNGAAWVAGWVKAHA